MNKLGGLLAVALVFTAAVAVWAGEKRHECHVCGMYIDQYIKTAGALTYKDGRSVQSCGIACLLRMVSDEGGPDAFTSLLVTDWPSGTQIEAQAATYVLSSKLIPDMLPSIIAFKTPMKPSVSKRRTGAS